MLSPAQLIIHQAFMYMLEQTFKTMPQYRNELTENEAMQWLRLIADGQHRLSFTEMPDGVFTPTLS